MTLTFLDLYNECAGQPWSMYDNDMDSVEDFESALKGSINLALSNLWDEQPWYFKERTHLILTRNNQKNYRLPYGTLNKKTSKGITNYGVSYNGKPLPWISEFEALDDKGGEPEGFYIKNDELYLYPTPNNKYLVTVDYLLLPYGLNKEEDEIFELTKEDDYLNIPEQYESMFKNCAINLAMMYAIDDENDENYSGYKKRYEDSLRKLIKYCATPIVNRRIVF